MKTKKMKKLKIFTIPEGDPGVIASILIPSLGYLK